MLGRKSYRSHPPLTLLLGMLLLVLAVLAMQAALGLCFDPRYRDFPFAPLTGGVLPFLLVSVLRRATEEPVSDGRGCHGGGARSFGHLHRLQ